MEHLLEAGHVAGGILRPNDARTIEGETFEHRDADLVGEGGDIVDDNVDGRFGGDVPEVLLDAVLCQFELVRPGD